MSTRPSWMPKAPRVFFLAIFPVTTFILYLILELGCINDTMSVVSPIIVRSNGSVLIGAQTTAPIDLRIGFWGICFGPQPFTCTSSLGVFQSKSVGELTRAIPASRGGGNVTLARLALGLQANFAILSGVVLFVLVVLDLGANLVQIYFNIREEWECHLKAAIWARSFDWATAAVAVGAFSSYRALVVATPDLLRAAASSSAAPLPVISAGMVASNLFAAIVGVAGAGAVINTFLTMNEAGFVASQALLDTARRPGVRAGSGTGMGGVNKADIGGPIVYQRRPAYEVFP